MKEDPYDVLKSEKVAHLRSGISHSVVVFVTCSHNIYLVCVFIEEKRQEKENRGEEDYSST